MVDYHVDDLRYSVLLELLEVGESFASGNTENHAVHTVLLSAADGSGNERDLNTALDKGDLVCSLRVALDPLVDRVDEGG